MTKQQFLEALDERLNVLEARERADLLAEYAAHIDMKMADGLSEEAAIAAFGDFEELVNELLSAYHVDPHYRRGEDVTLSMTIRRIGRFFQDSIDALLNMNRQDGFRVLGRLFMLSVVVLVVILGMSILKHVFIGVVDGLSGIGFVWLRNIFIGIVELIFGLIHFAIICYAVYFFFNRYVIPEHAGQDCEEGVAMSRQEEMHESTNVPEKKGAFNREKRNDAGEERLANAFYLVVKILVVFAFFIPAVSTAAGMIASLGILGMMVIMGWPLVGPMMVVLGMLFILSAVISFVWGLTFQKGAE